MRSTLETDAEAAGDVARAALARHDTCVLASLQRARDAAGHAHRGERLGVAAARLGERRCAIMAKLVAVCVGSRVMISVSSVSDAEDDGAEQRGEADAGMEAESR